MFKSTVKDRLNPEALKIVMMIAEVLLRYLDAYGKPTNYKHLMELIQDRFGVRIWYRNSLPHYLGLLMPMCKELGIPPLSATVVRRDSGIPGGGFVPWYKKHFSQSGNIEDEQLARNLRDEAIHFPQWQLLLDYLGIDYQFRGNRIHNSTSSCPVFYPYVEEDFSDAVF